MAASHNLTKTLTRKNTAHFILEQPSDLPINVLPREGHTFNYIKEKQKGYNNVSLKNIAPEIAEDVIKLWIERGYLLTISLRQVIRKVEVI